MENACEQWEEAQEKGKKSVLAREGRGRKGPNFEERRKEKVEECEGEGEVDEGEKEGCL